MKKNQMQTIIQDELPLPKPVSPVLLPAPTAREASAILTATSRVRERRRRTQLGSSPNAFDGRSLHPPHSDPGGFIFQLRDAFGTTAKAFVQDQLKHIIRIVGNDNGKPDTDAVNAVIAMVDGIRPRTKLKPVSRCRSPSRTACP